MNCPVCKTKLAYWQHLPLETAEEHVFYPNATPSMRPAYRCPKTDCPTNGKKFGVQPLVYWNADGELYGNPKGITFIDNNMAPFESICRKINY